MVRVRVRVDNMGENKCKCSQKDSVSVSQSINQSVRASVRKGGNQCKYVLQ